MSESRTVHDPFLGKDVQVSNSLVDRLRGKYARGPTMANGEPEFGWREFQTPPIQHEAAAEIERLKADLSLSQAEKDAADEVSRTARSYVDGIPSLIVRYFQREIGRLMHQAEHWAKNDKPLAVHHRVTKADAYYQVVALFERHGQHDQNVFDIIQSELGRQELFPPGAYPASADLHRYRNPTFICEMLSGEQHASAIEGLYVPGQWRCPKCRFVLHQMNLNANDGSVTTRDQAGDKCPNCDKPLWRVTWKEDAMEMAERAAEQVQRAVAAEKEVERLKAELSAEREKSQ